MKYRFTFGTHEKHDCYIDHAMKAEWSEVSSDPATILAAVLTRAYNYLMGSDCFLVEVRPEEHQRILGMTEQEKVRGHVMVDIYAMTPCGSYVRLSVDSSPIYAGWEPSAATLVMTDLHRQNCFPEFFGEVISGLPGTGTAPTSTTATNQC